MQWRLSDKQTVEEHDLGKPGTEDMEHDLFWKWCKEEFPRRVTDRAKFVESQAQGLKKGQKGFSELEEFVEDPKSAKGLRDFADAFSPNLKFEGGNLAPAEMYPKVASSIG